LPKNDLQSVIVPALQEMLGSFEKKSVLAQVS